MFGNFPGNSLRRKTDGTRTRFAWPCSNVLKSLLLRHNLLNIEMLMFKLIPVLIKARAWRNDVERLFTGAILRVQL